MKQTISVGALVICENKVLMVNHKRTDRYDFWVAPGGGVQFTESLEEAVVREAKEETGINVSVKKLMYIEELYNPQERIVKFWYHCEFINGLLDCTAQEAISEHIVDVAFMDKSDLNDNIVFPSSLLGDFWDEVELEGKSPKFLGLRKMEFY